MTQLSLWFTKHNEYVLERSAFYHPLLESELRAVRGKRAGAYQGYNTFQWTPALKAMVILLARTAASTLRAELNGPILKGCESSPASSFDYSLGKNPNWILDIFGVDKSGNSIARKLFNRTNPERKRGGDVLIAVNQKVLSGRCINFYLDENLCRDAEEIDFLADSIENSWMPHGGHSNISKVVSLRTPARCSQTNNHKQKRQTLRSDASLPASVTCPCCGDSFSLWLGKREEHIPYRAIV